MIEQEPKIEKSPHEKALEKVLSGEKETVCFPAGEELPAVDLKDCELIPVKDNPGVYAIVSHEQTGTVGYTKNPNLTKDIKSGEMFSDDFYE